ncbi:MAG: hypothetical protein L0Y38_06290 [Methylococcaceae bacterium]|nr:hypothetical protein [Methylococcaceae bacterium]MCI0666734.1 hypothetical protein [Methylococcaceae bacterium]MCI0733416.1 hypothetical protein [Methylococcaceae bacterium]
MLRFLVYALLIYFGLLAMMAYGHVDRLYYWIAVYSASSFFGLVMGNLFGGIDLRELQDDRY